jgi:hypothetical protein
MSYTFFNASIELTSSDVLKVLWAESRIDSFAIAKHQNNFLSETKWQQNVITNIKEFNSIIFYYVQRQPRERFNIGITNVTWANQSVLNKMHLLVYSLSVICLKTLRISFNVPHQ